MCNYLCPTSAFIATILGHNQQVRIADMVAPSRFVVLLWARSWELVGRAFPVKQAQNERGKVRKSKSDYDDDDDCINRLRALLR